MQKRGIILWFGWVALALVALVSSYWVFIVKENFSVLATTTCDPTKETCFVYKCDSENPANASELCALSEDHSLLYYTYIFKKKSQIPSCDRQEENCAPWVCEKSESGCEKVVCSDETLHSDFVAEGAECSIYVPPAPAVEEEPIENAPESDPIVDSQPVFPSDLAPSTEENMPVAPSEPSSVPSVGTPTETVPVSPIPYDPSTDTSL
ncbi:MAG: hypothetical protein KIH67_003740 [Candidatus Moranbacteria bacterium]|nr:hypothetical protein [Candidatus Moranbacteria bacterium]